MRLAFYQPDIPQNLGAAFRLAACFSAPVDIIEPCGFPLSDKALRRTAMDYGERISFSRHDGWQAFLMAPERKAGRLILFTTKGTTRLEELSFTAGDTLLFGRESAGAPEEVHAAAAERALIPLAQGLRSLNVAMAAGIALWQGLKQTGGLPRGS